MPNTSSAKKALRQNVRKRKMNIARKSDYKKAIKEFRSLIDSKKMDEAAESLKSTFKKLDKAAKKNTIKKNKASRLKSRLSQLANKSSKASS